MFSKDVAKIFGKGSCKICWGRGWITTDNSYGMPIVNEKKNEEGQIIMAASPLIINENFCVCAKKRLEKLKVKVTNG